jgi:rubrerythrin
MSEIDKVLGIVKQAIEIEKFGHDFYNSMRSFVEEREGQLLVSYLARLEVDHIKWLEEEYEKQLSKIEEFDEKATVNLSLLGKDEIFFADERVSTIFKDFDPVKATSFAIDIEKKSVEFYNKNMDVSEDDRTRDLFKRLADFEKEHIIILTNNLRSLESEGKWEEPPTE